MIRILAATAAALVLSTSAFAAAVPVGLWRLTSGKADIRISDCGGEPCATIVALRKPNDKQGRPKRDRYNPQPSLRERPVVGVSLLKGMKPAREGWAGTFYNPDDGRFYAGTLVATGPDTITLRGCIAAMFCKTQVLKKLD